MGYCVNISFSGAIISADKVNAALKAINDLHDPEVMENNGARGGSWQGGKKTGVWYGFVENPPEGGFKDLSEAFNAWNFGTVSYDGCIEMVDFFGEKWSDQETLFTALAPFMMDGSEIIVSGEDGEIWGYRYSNGEIQHGRAQMVWG